MRFHIEHTTAFQYPTPATESFSELRLRPRDNLRQNISHYTTRVSPVVAIEDYKDYFGNHVETVSIPFRHHELSVTSICDVETRALGNALSELNLTIGEARMLYRSDLRELHDFLRPSRFIPFQKKLHGLAAEHLPQVGDFASSLLDLNHWLFKNMKYTPGATDANTDIRQVIDERKGVCQDYAHLMIGMCRMAGIPARYISGYIETEPSPDAALVGATASHAWLEIYTPNGHWVGLDPTNDIMEGERHVQIGIGRDYNDVMPMKGVFKGPNRQTLSVAVKVTRHDAPGKETVKADRFHLAQKGGTSAGSRG